MILESLLLSSNLCMKITNSVVVVGLYYGFLSTFSIGPSYFFLVRSRFVYEIREKEISATTGFIMGQLLMFVSIYYTPLYLALNRPHTMTLLLPLYLMFHTSFGMHDYIEDLFVSDDDDISPRKRKLRIQLAYLNNLIFQLFNPFLLPSATLARLITIYMFRCDNKILFVTSSFVGWLIGHILFIKCLELAVICLWDLYRIWLKRYMMGYIMFEFREKMGLTSQVILTIICIYYLLGVAPSPILCYRDFRKEKEILGMKEKENDVERRKDEDNQVDEDEEESTEEDKDNLVDENEEGSNEEDKDNLVDVDEDPEGNLYLEVNKAAKPIVTFLFDYKRWTRPDCYIENDEFGNSAVQDELSQYFFYICSSDGKQRISFTYPPSLSTFSEMIERKIALYTKEKLSQEDLYNYWVYTNDQKKYNLKNELISRIKILEKKKGSLTLDILEKKTRLCLDQNRKEYLPKRYDPLLNGPYRGTIKNLDSDEIINDLITSTADSVEMFWINKIHGLFYNNFRELEHQRNTFGLGEELLLNSNSIENSLTSIDELSAGIVDSETEIEEKSLQFFFDVIPTDQNDLTTIRKKSTPMKEISKKVSRWSYYLIEDVYEEEMEGEEDTALVPEIAEMLSPPSKRVLLLSYDELADEMPNRNPSEIKKEEVYVLVPDWDADEEREIIRGTMRNLRRKIPVTKVFQARVHSPFFLRHAAKIYFFQHFSLRKTINFILKTFRKLKEGEILEFLFSFFDKKAGKNKPFQLDIYSGIGIRTSEEFEEREKMEMRRQIEMERMAMAEVWEMYSVGPPIRSLLLLLISFLRKYVIFPLFIIVKNTALLTLLGYSEWNADWKDLKNEVHMRCNYDGMPVSETELPEGWFFEGFHIKVLRPFYLQFRGGSHHRDRNRNQNTDPRKRQRNYFYLTVAGLETDYPFGPPRLAERRHYFWAPFLKEVSKSMLKNIKKLAKVIRVLKKKTERFLKVLKKKVKKLAKEQSFNLIEGEVDDEPNENGEDSNINNKIIRESTSPMQSAGKEITENFENLSPMEELTYYTIYLRTQIEDITKDTEKIIQTCDDKRSASQKNLWQIFKRKSIRFICKSPCFVIPFIEKIYIYLLLRISKIARINAELLGELFIESTKKISNYFVYNDNDERKIEKIKQKTMDFILTSFSNTKIKFSNDDENSNNENANIYRDLSSLSQAYVFYKLSQNQLLNKYPLKSVLQHHGTYPFLRDIIKNSCTARGLFDSKPRHNKIHKSGANKWKNWLRGHYQYNLSQAQWSCLEAQKWRNRVNQCCTIQKKDSMKAVRSSMSQNEKWKKRYGYDLFSYKYLNYDYGNSKDSYIYGLQVEDKKIPYNFDTLKPESFYRLISIAISDCLKKGFMTKKDRDRKFLDCRIPRFKTIKTPIKIQNLQKVRDPFNDNYKNYYKNYYKKDYFFNWMGMNQKRGFYPIDSFVLSEFLLPFRMYMNQPWIIPIKLLIFDKHFYKKIKQSKKIDINQKKILSFLANQKEYPEFQNSNKKENKQQGQGDLVSDVRKQKKDVEKDSTKADRKKGKKNRNQGVSAESLILEGLFHEHQFKWGNKVWPDPEIGDKCEDNIELAAVLLKMRRRTFMLWSLMFRGALSVELILWKEQRSLETLMVKKGEFFIEELYVLMQPDGKNIIYQIISISLVDKNKHQTHGKWIRKNRNKKHYDLLVPENILSPRRRRELRILTSFNSQNWNVVDRNPIFCNKNCGQFLNGQKHLNTDANKLMKFKLFLWPNYRLEDLACMNRYWFDSNKGNNYSILRLRMYPR
uniref:Translocon at the inner envelope membrane of chloroplasts 214 n=1 Tax=Eustrephus latifolius TaxID=101708 RepID=A0A0U1XE07_EUSLA|nr:hypothetical protein ycf1 [Eustrephus latifolius]YP_009092739.1 hypothetical protein ycf1 [Eustrephus latifolius]AIR12578.1 hypothetical protein ycf1 [Eustrephus latifolius]AIR12579.1 hypothetical protein ycf1 [Eustrephus latifolius]